MIFNSINSPFGYKVTTFFSNFCYFNEINALFSKKELKYLVSSKKSSTFAADLEKINGAIAQLVEQRTENPCVPGSIPGGTTQKRLQESLKSFLHLRRF